MAKEATAAKPENAVKASGKKTNVKRLVLTAVLIGMATVLSLIKVYQLPLGGSITLLSMLPIALVSIEYGIGWGMVGAFTYSLIQFGFGIADGVFGWGLSPLALVACIALDYILAYTSLGLAGAFRKKGTPGIIAGVALAIVMRFVFHLLSGALVFDIWMPEEWSNPWLYSCVYNGSYMLPELIFTMIGAIVLFKTPQFAKLVSSNLED